MKREPTSLLLHKAMGHQKWLCPGKPVASLVESLLSSLTGRCVARLDRRSRSMSDAQKLVDICE